MGVQPLFLLLLPLPPVPAAVMVAVARSSVGTGWEAPELGLGSAEPGLDRDSSGESERVLAAVEV